MGRTRRDALLGLAGGAAALTTGESALGAAPAAAAVQSEAALEPGLPILDAHHHLSPDYSFDAYHQDIRTSGHNIVGTVFVDCLAYYRADGPVAMRPLGEVEYANGVAAQSASGAYGKLRGACAIVGHADLTSDGAAALLDAQIAAAGGRFKGIRVMAAYDADPNVLGSLARILPPAPHHYAGDRFRAGFKLLWPRGLSFDAWVLEPQLGDVIDLARAFPDTPIILNHVGAPLGIGVYKGKQAERFSLWRTSMREIAACPNVSVKLGGLGEAYQGLTGPGGGVRLTSQQLAALWRPYLETAIELFGVERAMFESDFPVEKAAMDYATLWNALKRVVAGASADEKRALFFGTAARVYRIADLPG